MASVLWDAVNAAAIVAGHARLDGEPASGATLRDLVDGLGGGTARAGPGPATSPRGRAAIL